MGMVLWCVMCISVRVLVCADCRFCAAFVSCFARLLREASEKYEFEMINHSKDVEELQRVRKEATELKQEVRCCTGVRGCFGGERAFR